MKTNARNLMMVIAAVAMTACTSNTDLYDAGAINEQKQLNAKESYVANFAKKYPNVDMNQNWDFSSKTPYLTFGNTDNRSNARTRAGEDNVSTGDWYYVDNETLDWMHDRLTEGEDHRDLGNPFYMSVPGNDFTIVPIYQGQAGAMWNLHVVVDGVDYTIFEKINFESLGGTEPAEGERAEQNETKTGSIQIQDADSDEWHNLHGQWFDWGYGHWNSLYNTDGSDRWTPDWSGRNKVTAVRSTPITFHNFRVGADMYFYLEITADGNDRNGDVITNHRNNTGDKLSSVQGQMLALNGCPVPVNLAGNEVMIIGCEDANVEKYDIGYEKDDEGKDKFRGSDWDMNDLVILVYGKEVPKPVEIKEGDTYEKRTTVRYMVEDLGSTDDFDFNDIVIDVADIDIITPTYTNKVLTSETVTGHRQEAVIRHLGGTLPFTLTIGETELPEMGGQSTFQSDPNSKFDVTGWNMNTHNVFVNVQQKDNEGVWTVKFPKAGEAPMIIAVDPFQVWMPERQSVPESWFTK
ncbi:MAG: hypothetical protein IJ067_05865 [Prevotella sp.]|nr:hypothetical protein [Prevotella sp.]